MIKVYVKKQTSYPLSASKIKNTSKEFLKKNGIVSDAVVEIAIVGKNKMLKLAEEYLGEKDVLHNVLSFPSNESRGKFVLPPEAAIHLGEVVICYPKAVDEANGEGLLIEEKVLQLIEHGLLHLMGVHHD